MGYGAGCLHHRAAELHLGPWILMLTQHPHALQGWCGSALDLGVWVDLEQDGHVLFLWESSHLFSVLSPLPFQDDT